MSKKQQSTFPIVIPKSITGRELKFKSFDELSTWAVSESRAFEWIRQHNDFSRHHITRVTYHHINNILNQLINLINEGSRNFNNTLPYEGNIQRITNFIHKTYQNDSFILSNSRIFKKTVNIAETDFLKSVAFLAAAVKLPNLLQQGINEPAVLEAILEYFLDINALGKNNVKHERSILNDLKNEWDIHNSELKDQKESWNAEIMAIKTNFEEYVKTSENTFQEQLNTCKKDLIAQETVFNNLQASYREHMSLKAPVDYWNKKEEYHTKRIKPYTAASLLLGLVGCIAFSLMTYCLLSSDNENIYWKFTILAVTGTLFFWLLRVLVKILLSHIHLRSDAQERQVMVQTYLSLLTEDSNLNEDARQLILASLFRPTGTAGVIKDDGIPPGVYDVLTKVISK